MVRRKNAGDAAAESVELAFEPGIEPG